MKILITGSNGLLGKELIERLSQENTIYAIVRDKKKVSFKTNPNINIIEADLKDLNLENLNKEIDAIYYLAQSNRFREFPEGVQDMFEININIPLKLIEWASKNKVLKFIYASSGGVYTNPEKPVKEFFDINANEKQGFYINTKLTAEILLKNFSDYFETFAIIRPFFMYGEEQNNTMLIPRLINSVKNENEIILSGDEGIKINPIYISDAVSSVKEILNLKGEHILNIAGYEVVSLKELSNLIGKIVNKEPIFNYNKNIQNDLVADISLMKEKLSSPLVSLQEGIERVINK